MSPAEKAAITRAENKARKAHRSAVERYGESHDMRPYGTSYGLSVNLTCNACGASVRQADLFKDSADTKISVCSPCVDSSRP